MEIIDALSLTSTIIIIWFFYPDFEIFFDANTTNGALEPVMRLAALFKDTLPRLNL